MSTSNGWIKIHRKMMDSVVSTDPILLAVWVQLLLRANFERRQLLTGQWLEPGELVIGQTKFAKSIGITRKQLRRCVLVLEKCENVATKGARSGTTITINNWEKYQLFDDAADVEGPDKGPDRGQIGARRGPQNNNNKNDEKGENGKKEISNAAHPLSSEQAQSDGSGKADDFFKRWNPWIEENGKGRMKKVLKLSKARRVKINQRMKDTEWFPTFQAALSLLPLASSQDGDWQPTLDWMVRNDENVYRLLEGQFDFRMTSTAARKLEELRRRKATQDREDRIEREKNACKKSAHGTRKAINDILPAQDGESEDGRGSSLLFG